jgi:hypothetical protein
MEKTIKISLDTAKQLIEAFEFSANSGDERSKSICKLVYDNFTKKELESKKGYTFNDCKVGEGYFISNNGYAPKHTKFDENRSPYSKEVYKTEKQAFAACAFSQLTHIVAKYNEGKKFGNTCHQIGIASNGELLIRHTIVFCPEINLCFADEDDAKTSFEINRELWKQYWMIS